MIGGAIKDKISCINRDPTLVIVDNRDPTQVGDNVYGN